MANIFDSIPALKSLGWPKEIYNMMPFIASMVVLAFTSKKSRAPKPRGHFHDQGSAEVSRRSKRISVISPLPGSLRAEIFFDRKPTWKGISWRGQWPPGRGEQSRQRRD